MHFSSLVSINKKLQNWRLKEKKRKRKKVQALELPILL